MTRVTLLAGGDSVYVYPDINDDPGVAERVAIQRAVLDVAYPASETEIATVREERLADICKLLANDGITVVDTREEGR